MLFLKTKLKKAIFVGCVCAYTMACTSRLEDNLGCESLAFMLFETVSFLHRHGSQGGGL